MGDVREVRKEGAASGVPKVAESGRNRENYATLRSISEWKNRKEAEANKYRVGPGIKVYRKGKV